MTFFYLITIRRPPSAQTSREFGRKGFALRKRTPGLKGRSVLGSFGVGQTRGQSARMKVSKRLDRAGCCWHLLKVNVQARHSRRVT